MLFENLPRTKRIIRMKVVDAGCGRGGNWIAFECWKCGHETGWLTDEWTVTENRRGLPCPVCNPGIEHSDEVHALRRSALNTGEKTDG